LKLENKIKLILKIGLYFEGNYIINFCVNSINKFIFKNIIFFILLWNARKYNEVLKSYEKIVINLEINRKNKYRLHTKWSQTNKTV